MDKLSRDLARNFATFYKIIFFFNLITNEVLDFIYENHHHVVTEWDGKVLSPAAIQLYAESISRKEFPLNYCFGFVDGTFQPISRPESGKRVVYNLHKTVHCSIVSVYCFTKWNYRKHLLALRSVFSLIANYINCCV